MKRNEIALVIVVVGVVVIGTYVILNFTFGKTALSSVKVKSADLISSSVTKPDPAVFNQNGINPAINVTIGDQANEQPFSSHN